MPQSTSVLRRNGFTFKQFFVAHDRCAMKVGTDGILLGAWAPVAGVKRILDIGTGSGLLALMLAQRTDENVIIDAVELDVDAAQQAQENIAQSPWMHRVSIHTEDAQRWVPRQTVRFDLIISNPPYYEQGVECATPQREQARYTTTLDHQALLTLAADSITEEGFFVWCCRNRSAMHSPSRHSVWAGICDCARMLQKRKPDYRIGYCWHSPRWPGSALATGW